jgi:triosephosphate isomerase
MQKVLLVGNWKMNPQSFEEAKELFLEIKRGIKDTKKVEVAIAPPFVFLYLLKNLAGSSVSLASQDSFWEKKGAFTGEISPLMLKKLKVKYVILGHSERRIYLGENDQMIGKKINAVLEAGLKAILCVGEKSKEDPEKIVKEQIKNALSFVEKKVLLPTNLILAYEPVWAIGTGNFCPPQNAREMLFYIKRILFSLLGERWKGAKVLYGGSVDPSNAKSYLKVGFNGLLIGGTSLKPKAFLEIINSI